MPTSKFKIHHQLRSTLKTKIQKKKRIKDEIKFIYVKKQIQIQNFTNYI